MDQTKPYKGCLMNWVPVVHPRHGIFIIGQHVDHLVETNRWIMTSYLVLQEGDEIETLNSRYTLVDDNIMVH